MANSSDVEVKTRELSEMILESDEYQRYQAAKIKLAETPDLKYQADEYRKRSFFVQSSSAGNNQEERNNLMREYADVLKRNCVKEYLDSEIVLCRMLQRVNEMIYKDINVEVNFL